MNSITRFDNWSNDSEELVNEQINMELRASMLYQSISAYFARDNVGLLGISEFFHKSSIEESEHAKKFIDYQNKRGGKVVFKDITNLEYDYPGNNNEAHGSVLHAFYKALEMEQSIYKHLLKLHESADPQFADFLESEFLSEQIDALYEIGVYITQIKKIGNNGYGIWEFNNKIVKTT